MASLMEELIDTLDKEDRLYTDLIPIQEEKIRAVIANDLESLQNKQLLTEALEMVEFNMNVIRSTRMSSGSSNYSSNAAQVDIGDYGAGMFDAKQ